MFEMNIDQRRPIWTGKIDSRKPLIKCMGLQTYDLK